MRRGPASESESGRARSGSRGEKMDAKLPPKQTPGTMQIFSGVRGWLGFASIALCFEVLSFGAGATTPVAPACMFNGREYLHRWNQRGQHEFTPAGQEDLVHWNDMITINVHRSVQDGDGLAELANRVLGTYKEARAMVVRAFSVPRTPDRPAEHLAVVVFQQLTRTEFAFARVKLVDSTGCVLVYSHREYGDESGDRVREWLEANGPDLETKWMAWEGFPQPVTLAARPDTAPEPRN